MFLCFSASRPDRRRRCRTVGYVFNDDDDEKESFRRGDGPNGGYTSSSDYVKTESYIAGVAITGAIAQPPVGVGGGGGGNLFVPAKS